MDSVHGPLAVVHYFNWYCDLQQRPLSEQLKTWTFAPEFEELGLHASDIGRTKLYYDVQFALVAGAGFDGVMWEYHSPSPDRRTWLDQPPWPPHGSHPPEEALESLEEHALRVGLFYDSEIRFRSVPQFIVPSPPLAEQMVRDITEFYEHIPPSSWLIGPSGELPIVLYGYQFSDRGSIGQWDAFFQFLIEGAASELGRRPVFHWTDSGSPAQAYAFQRFPEVRPFNFNPCHPQSALGATSVTFVISYDDYGVWKANEETPGAREHDLIINDPRLVEEALSLACESDPSLLFFYGWNELFEGEALLPDATHGRWRLDVAASIINNAKTYKGGALPLVALVSDNILTLAADAPSDASAVIALLRVLRTVIPRTVLVEPGSPIPVAASAVLYLTRRAPARDMANGAQVIWIPLQGQEHEEVSVPTIDLRLEAREVALQVAAALGLEAHDGPLLTQNWLRASRTRIEIVESCQPSVLPLRELPIERWRLVAPRGLPGGATLRLPTGFGNPRFEWVQGTPRPLVADQGLVRLHRGEVVDAFPQAGART